MVQILPQARGGFDRSRGILQLVRSFYCPPLVRGTGTSCPAFRTVWRRLGTFYSHATQTVTCKEMLIKNTILRS